MDISISNFRGFRQVDAIRLSRLTVLIGENSAGKTTFLAILSLLHDMFSRSELSFNREPFLLGAYEQIAYDGGRRSSRLAPQFSLTISDIVSPHSVGKSSGYKLPPLRSSLKLTFTNRYSQPALRSISFFAGTDSLVIDLDAANAIRINTKGTQETFDMSDTPFMRTSREEWPAYVLLNIVQDLQYLIGGKLLSKATRAELSRLSVYFNVLSDAVKGDVYASAPVRTRPDRAYTPTDLSQSAEGTHVPNLLAKLNRHQLNTWREIRSKINQFAREAGLFSQISVKKLGRSESDPFQIFVTIDNVRRNIMDVGYGVSQALPILVEVFEKTRPTLFLLQQPEVHLHPRAQAALGSLFASAVAEFGHSFVLETHSDYIFDRIRMSVRDSVVSTDDVTILYFERSDDGNTVVNCSIDSNGNITDAPSGFRRFFVQEAFRSVGVE